MKREFKVQEGKQDRISSDKMGKSVHVGAGYTKIHIRQNILISGIFRYPANPPPKMPDTTVFTVNTVPGQMGIVDLQSSFVNLGEDKKTSIDAPFFFFPVICCQRCDPLSLATYRKFKRVGVVLKSKTKGKKVRWSEVLQTATSAVRDATTKLPLLQDRIVLKSRSDSDRQLMHGWTAQRRKKLWSF